MSTKEFNSVPAHIAIIMDGNGRWGQERGKSRITGHHEGVNRVKDILEAAAEIGVKYLTLFAFSEENWSRPEQEVRALFQLLSVFLRKETKRLNERDVRLKVIGNRLRLPKECLELIENAERETINNGKITLVIALSYSSRQEIINCCRRMAQQVLDGTIKVEDIDLNYFSSNLETNKIPDPDLLIRTSGELRVSNFLLWQLAYSELYFSSVFWPSFSKEHFFEAVRTYQNRQRRFGKVLS